MIAMWTEISKHVLHAPPGAYAPVGNSVHPHRHREWTNFDAKSPSEYARRNARQKGDASESTSTRKSANTIRARKNTKLKISGSELQLEFTGEDPGIAMDLRSKKLPAGPYKLTFQLVGGSKDGGEVFYTTNPKQTLPKGERIEFAILANGHPQQVSIDLPTTKSLQELRLDVCTQRGKATLSNLKLLNANGDVLVSWP
jgi:hypothetical protein